MSNQGWTLLYAGWLLTVCWLSLDPSPPEIEAGPLSWDKLQHGSAYAVMTILGGLSLRQWMQTAHRYWLAAAAIAVSVGILVEVAQGLMKAGRFADWQDAVANGLGAISALLLVALSRRGRCRRSGGRK